MLSPDKVSAFPVMWRRPEISPARLDDKHYERCQQCDGLFDCKRLIGEPNPLIAPELDLFFFPLETLFCFSVFVFLAAIVK